ncbi:hypothetical protein A2U01_0043484 [Trifolium medium]|uniref:Uncharacterized protein n=1 Tax=Trifolium medium TaxID=97028 RepID=A0A392QDS7_9FABA|nr:hypothetical protein [Trifolium medium]
MEPTLKCVKGNTGPSATASSRRKRESARQQELEHYIQVVPVPESEAGKGKCGHLHTK